jgi:hypothetical protein
MLRKPKLLVNGDSRQAKLSQFLAALRIYMCLVFLCHLNCSAYLALAHPRVFFF